MVVHASHASSGEVNGEPNGRLAFRRPRYTMGTMSGDQDIVTGTKIALAFSLDPKTGRAGDEQDPLVVFLIVGFVRRRGLAGRDDPLDSHALSPEQLREELLVRLTGKVVEEIDHSCTLAQLPQTRKSG